jgi:ribose 5-phosphate isomerase A
MASQEALKQKAAWRAVEFVTSGMVVGLGTGSTAKFAIERLAERLQAGDLKNISGIPSSRQTEALAQTHGVPLSDFEEHPAIDVTIDGADEVDPDLNLIKGGGGALLREKVLAQASRRNIIIVDESKMVPRLGTRWSLPVEVIPFARATELDFLRRLGAVVSLRTLAEGNPFITDQNNFILDANFGRILRPHDLARELARRAGIMEHGLFLDLATDVIVAGKDGIDHLQRSR